MHIAKREYSFEGGAHFRRLLFLEVVLIGRSALVTMCSSDEVHYIVLSASSICLGQR